MPIDPWIGPGLGLIGGLITAGTNAKNRKAQAEQNRQDREHEKFMYEWQRWDALADWNRQNAYDSPLQQMQRLREAGLNPNLVYGKGADNTSSMIRSVTPTPSSKPAPQVPGNAFMQGLNIMMAKTQTDNVAQQTALSKTEQLLKTAQIAKTGVETARSQFDLDQAHALNDMVIRQARLNNELTKVNIEKGAVELHFQLREDERRELANSANVQKTLNEILESKLRQAKMPQEIAQLKAAIRQLNSTAKLNEIDAILKAQGINPSDPAWLRIVMQQLIGEGVINAVTE